MQTQTIYRAEAGPLTTISASTRGPVLLVGGSQALVTLELQSHEEDIETPINFSFEKRRQLSSRIRQAPSCTGMTFMPGSDVIAASCSSTGSISLWDTVARTSEPLLKQWQGHTRNATALAFLPDTSSGTSSLISAGSDGSLYLWKLDRDLWEAKTEDSEEYQPQNIGHPAAGYHQQPWGSTSASSHDLAGFIRQHDPRRPLNSPANGTLKRQVTPENPAQRLWSSGLSQSLGGHSHSQSLGHGLDRLATQIHSHSASEVPIKQDLRPSQNNRCSIRDIHTQAVGDDAQILIAGTDGQALILNVADHTILRSCFVSHKPVLSARFHPHFPSIFAAAAQDQIVHILDAREKSDYIAGRLRVGTSVGCIRWRPERPEQIATSGSSLECMSDAAGDTGLMIWDLRKPFVPLHKFPTAGGVVSDFFWADTNHIVSCGRTSIVQLHSVNDSIQPLLSTCCTGASWAPASGGTESLAVVADSIARVSEPASDHVSVCRELSYALAHRGFATDTSLGYSGYSDIAKELRDVHESVRQCGLFSTVQTEMTETEQKLLELIDLAPFPPNEEKAMASVLCSREADRCMSKGLEVRAQTWSLLAKVTGDIPADTLLSSALMGVDAAAEGGIQSLLPIRGAGAKVSTPELSFSNQPSFSHRRDFSKGSNASAATAGNDAQTLVKNNIKTWKNAWRTQTLREIIEFHEERNDVGMLLALVAVFGIGEKPDSQITGRIYRWAQGAADVLSRYKAFVPRCALFRALSPLVPDVDALANRNTEIPVKCGFPHCGALLSKPHSEMNRKASNTAPRDLYSCTKCARRHTPPCTICGEAVRGVWTACQVCGHGGHMRCMKEWFSNGQRSCPAGCGHLCVPPQEADA